MNVAWEEQWTSRSYKELFFFISYSKHVGLARLSTYVYAACRSYFLGVTFEVTVQTIYEVTMNLQDLQGYHSDGDDLP